MATDEGVHAAEDLRRLAATMLEVGNRMNQEEGPFIPIGASMKLNGQVAIEVSMPGETAAATRDSLVGVLSRAARAGGIKAAGVMTANRHDELGEFLAVGMQHRDGTRLAVLQRFTRAEDGSAVLAPDLLLQSSPYEFFEAPGPVQTPPPKLDEAELERLTKMPRTQLPLQIRIVLGILAFLAVIGILAWFSGT